MATKSVTKKTPQDHKPVHVDVAGIDVTVDPKLLDDFELISDLYDLQHAEEDESGALAIVALFRRVFGKQAKAVLDALRVDGRVPNEDAANAVTTVLKAAVPNS